ncbi:MAG: class I SAM-dependent methyltransferase [Anaerolineae bacterium]
MSRFDEIAAVYDAQIPEHIRLHLLRRKVEMMTAWLEGMDRDELVGLDLGCGTGWHVKRFHEKGFRRVFGLDNSAAQLYRARENAGVEENYLCLSDIRRLPCADSSVDFAYAINVIHHLRSRKEQEESIAEINRVVKPGGLFFLHEINTTNPIMAFYMNHIFPRMKRIDNGLENWIPPDALPHLPGFELLRIEFFTFMPDFTPRPLFTLARWLEGRLEAIGLGRWGAHYMATLRRI